MRMAKIHIPFHIPYISGKESDYLREAIDHRFLSGDGRFSTRVTQWWNDRLRGSRFFLTPSCTHALEMAALLSDIRPGDEVILPSFTFVSTANAFVLRGAKLVFADICPGTMNLDPEAVASAVTSQTKAIAVMHYAGVACDMEAIMDIATTHGLSVVEDAAHGPGAGYKGQPLGSIGHFGAYSFHDTKNIHCGEGGGLIVREAISSERAAILRDKGTNRKQFLQGAIDRYTWVDIGSSYAPGELEAAFLYAQVLKLEEVNQRRRMLWAHYRVCLSSLEQSEQLILPHVPEGCDHNAHLFYVKCRSRQERSELIIYLRERGVESAFHYIPLHSAPAGLRYGHFHGTDRYTTSESEKLLRLPLYYDLTAAQVEYIAEKINAFYHKNKTA